MSVTVITEDGDAEEGSNALEALDKICWQTGKCRLGSVYCRPTAYYTERGSSWGEKQGGVCVYVSCMWSCGGVLVVLKTDTLWGISNACKNYHPQSHFPAPSLSKSPSYKHPPSPPSSQPITAPTPELCPFLGLFCFRYWKSSTGKAAKTEDNDVKITRKDQPVCQLCCSALPTLVIQYILYGASDPAA